MPVIHRVPPLLHNQTGLNRALAEAAQRFIYGTTEEHLSSYVSCSQSTPPVLEPGDLGFLPPRLARAHEFTWHRLVSAIDHDAADPHESNFSLDFEIIARGWHPHIIFPTNGPEFPSALKRVGDSIRVHFYNPEAHYALYDVTELMKHGQWEALIEVATKGLDNALSPQQAAALLAARGGALSELGRQREALTDCDEAIGTDPANFQGHLSKGVILSRQGTCEEAVESFTRAIDLQPRSPFAFEGRAHALSELGRLSEACEDYSRAIDLHDEPSHRAQCLFGRAVIHLGDMKYSAALADIDCAIDHKADFRSYLLKAHLHSRLEQVDDAISAASRALDVAEDDDSRAIALRERGASFGDATRFDDAVADFRRCAEISDSGEVQANLGLTLLMAGRLVDAEQALSLALKLAPDHAKAHNDLGMLYAIQDRHPDAIRSFEAAIRCSGEPSDVASAYRNMAVSLVIEGQSDGALEALRNAEAIAPESVLTTMARGNVGCHIGEFEEAINWHKKAEVELGDRNPFLIPAMLGATREADAMELLAEVLSKKPPPITVKLLLMHIRAVGERYPSTHGIEQALNLLTAYPDRPAVEQSS
jgi:tetratricopeptide (TPR) repeat protein